MENLILQLTNPDNKTRGEAEAVFLEAAKTPEVFLPQLIQTLRNPAVAPALRSMACILFRRYCFQDERMLWSHTNAQVQAQLKAILLQSLTEVAERDVRQKLCHVISAVGKADSNWPELLPFMFECCKSPNPNLQESALEIFSNLPEIFGNTLPRYVSVIKEVFQSSLLSEHSKVKLAALKATVAFILNIEDANGRNLFADLLSPMLQVIAMALNTNDEDAARDAISSYIELAESTPTLLRKSLDALIPAMSQITAQASLEDGTRHVALELLVTLSEQAPGMIRKFPGFVHTVYPAAWSLMVDLDDDADWHTTNDIEVDEMDSNPIVGEQAIDRIACAMGGKAVLPYVFTVLPGMLQNQDWKHRYAALMTLSAIGEGCHKVMEKEIDKIVSVLVNLLKDPHPRVRYALCNALGQMSTDFAPTIQTKFHTVVLPVFLTAMEDKGNPRVQAHGAAALVNFCEEATKLLLSPYLDTILSKLIALIRMPDRRYVLEQAVTTLATVADRAEDKFLPYYDTFMPVLIELLGSANGKELRLLRGKTIECISLIGLAVGKEKFLKDTKQVMDLLMNTQTTEMDPDDPQISYLLSSWARIGAVLGEDFIPYLPVVMPSLLRSATLKPDLAIIDAGDDEEAYDPAEGWQVLKLEDDQKIGIKTSILEEKCTAVEMLYCYAKELKGGFHQYAAQVLEIVVPLLKFYFDENVRAVAAATIAPLLKSLQLGNHDPTYINGLWRISAEQLLEVMQPEPEPEIACKLFEGFYTSVDAMGDNCLTQEQLSKFTEAINSQITEAIRREQERRERRNEEDYDEEVEETLENENASDEYVLREISEAIHSVFKTHKENYLPFFNPLVATVIEILKKGRSPPQRQLALSIVDDIIEFTGANSWMYHEQFLPALVIALEDEVPEIRQVAAYGAGICGKCGGQNYASFCAKELIPRLLNMVVAEGSRDDENISATENAISAIAKIIEFNSSQFDANQLLGTWLSFLPLLVDTEESAHCSNFLVRLIEGNHPAILGPNNSNLPKIFSVFAEVLATETLEEHQELVTRIANLLKTIEGQVPEQARPALWSQVTDEYRVRLAELFR